MNVVAAVADLLRASGLDVLLGSTLVLGAVAIAVALTPSAAGRRQLLRCGLVAGLLYGVVAVVPLPRWSPAPRAASDEPPATANPVALHLPEAPRAQPIDLPVVAPDPTDAAPPVVPPPPLPSQPVAVTPFAAPMSTALPDPAVLVAGALLLASGALLAHHLLGWWRLRRLLARSTPAPAALLAGVALPAGVTVHIADRDVQPFCTGVLRRRIVLPPALAAPSCDSEFVLRHEVAHLRAGDTRWRAFAVLLRPLLFWQPLFWLLQARLRFCDELLADDLAADGQVGDYVRAMLALAARSGPRVRGAPATFVFHRRTELFRRFQMMLQREIRLSPSTSRLARSARAFATAVLIAGCGAVFGVERAVAQDPATLERLRVEITELRDLNAQLRAEIAELRQGEPSAAVAADAPPVCDLRQEGGQVSLRMERLPLDRFLQMAQEVTQAVYVCDAALVAETKPLTLEGEIRCARAEFADFVQTMLHIRGLALARTGAGDMQRFEVRAVQDPVVEAPTAGAVQIGNEPFVYTVRTGDTFEKIALTVFGSRAGAQRLRALNPDVDAHRLRPGQQLRIGPIESVKPTVSARPAVPADGASAVDRRSLGAVTELVTRCIELRGQVRIAEIEITRAEERWEDGAGSRHDVEIAKIGLETRQRQLEAVRGLLRRELDAAKAELARAEALRQKGFVTQREVDDLAALVGMLSSGQ